MLFILFSCFSVEPYRFVSLRVIHKENWKKHQAKRNNKVCEFLSTGSLVDIFVGKKLLLNSILSIFPYLISCLFVSLKSKASLNSNTVVFHVICLLQVICFEPERNSPHHFETFFLVTFINECPFSFNAYCDDFSTFANFFIILI